MIRDQKSNKHIADGYKKLFRAFKREAVQFLVAKNLAVSHLTLEALPAVQTWTANCKGDCKTMGTGHYVVCGLRFSKKNLMLKVSNVEETGTSKLRDSNTHEEKLRAHTIVTQYLRHCQLALGEAKRFPSAESSLWEKKTTYPPSARHVQRKQNAFSRIIKCATFAVWKCELPLVNLKCTVQNAAWSKIMFFFTSTNRRYREKQKKNNKKSITCSEGSNIFLQRKGLGIDILLIEEVVLVYHAVNEFADSDENYWLSDFCWNVGKWFYLAIVSKTSQSACSSAVFFRDANVKRESPAVDVSQNILAKQHIYDVSGYARLRNNLYGYVWCLNLTF